MHGALECRDRAGDDGHDRAGFLGESRCCGICDASNFAAEFVGDWNAFKCSGEGCRSSEDVGAQAQSRDRDGDELHIEFAESLFKRLKSAWKREMDSTGMNERLSESTKSLEKGSRSD